MWGAWSSELNPFDAMVTAGDLRHRRQRCCAPPLAPPWLVSAVPSVSIGYRWQGWINLAERRRRPGGDGAIGSIWPLLIPWLPVMRPSRHGVRHASAPNGAWSSPSGATGMNPFDAMATGGDRAEGCCVPALAPPGLVSALPFATWRRCHRSIWPPLNPWIPPGCDHAGPGHGSRR